MRLAIQEDMLPGESPLEKCQQAKALGIEGIEYWGAGLTSRVPNVVAAIQQSGVAASAVNYGTQGQLINADRPSREAALAAFRDCVVNAVDLHAAGVVVIPHVGPPAVPDLTPYKSLIQLEYELLHNHLRTLSDYVYAIGVDLYIQPVNHYETHFITTLSDAIRVRRRIKDHPHVKIAADVFHTALEESDPAEAMRSCGADLGHVYVSDHNRRLPGQGMIDFGTVAKVLSEVQYNGWVTITCGQPGHNGEQAKHILNALPASIEVLRRAGF